MGMKCVYTEIAAPQITPKASRLQIRDRTRERFALRAARAGLINAH